MNKLISKKLIPIYAAFFLLPIVSFAQTPNQNIVTETRTLRGLANLFIEYLNIAIYLIIAIATVTFVWNVYLYFFTEKDKTEAGKYVMYSVIGFFIILSFWGFVAILRNSIRLPDQRPSFPFGNIQGGQINNSTPNPNVGPF